MVQDMEGFFMEERKDSIHGLNLQERKKGTITGVVDVMSFDSEQICLETTQGMMTIKGKELHVSRLQLESGEVDVEGIVDSLIYTEQGFYGNKKKGSLIKRLFQ